LERTTIAASCTWRNGETLLGCDVTYGKDVLGMTTEDPGGLGLGRSWYSVGGKEWCEHRGPNLHPTLLVLNGNGLAV
jgi:hypothetical protein